MEEQKYIEQPKDLRKNLYPHQLRNVYRMELLEKEKRIKPNNDLLSHEQLVIDTNLGILSDETGYGKTICMVALILRNKMDWDLSSGYSEKHICLQIPGLTIGNNFVVHEKLNTTLILVGPSIIDQWVSEFSYTNLSVGVVKTKKHADNVKATDYDVVLVSSNQFKCFISRYNGLCWKRFVYDEPGNINVPRMHRVIAGFTWFITATPNIIRERSKHRPGFLQEISRHGPLRFLIPFIEIKNTPEALMQSFNMPPASHVYHNCKNTILKALNGFVNNNIINMIKGGNMVGVVQALGGTIVSNISDLIELTLRKKRKELGEIQTHVSRWEERKDKVKFDLWKNRENAVLTQISELEKRVKDMSEGLCPICFETINKPIMEPECKNLFCASCVFEWLKTHKTCPTCRANICPTNLIYVKGTDEISDLPTKTEMMTKLIRENPGQKFIIYSAYEESFQGIRTSLKELEIPFIEMSGSADQRAKKLEKFRGSVDVAFLNSGQDSAGINMEVTSHIILYHEMSPDTVQQIIGRANRIGRVGSVTVHHLEN